MLYLWDVKALGQQVCLMGSVILVFDFLHSAFNLDQGGRRQILVSDLLTLTFPASFLRLAIQKALHN